MNWQAVIDDMNKTVKATPDVTVSRVLHGIALALQVGLDASGPSRPEVIRCTCPTAGKYTVRRGGVGNFICRTCGLPA